MQVYKYKKNKSKAWHDQDYQHWKRIRARKNFKRIYYKRLAILRKDIAKKKARLAKAKAQQIAWRKRRFWDPAKKGGYYDYLAKKYKKYNHSYF